MGRGGKGLFNPYAKTDRQVSKMIDDIIRLVFFGGILGVDYLSKTTSYNEYTYNRLPTSEELLELEKLDKELAKPFHYRRILIGHLSLYSLALVSPILGFILYRYDVFWMFFSILIFGFLELMFTMPAFILIDNIKCNWILDPQNKLSQIKQLKSLLLLAVVVNSILFVLNIYLFIVSYEGGVLVTIMTSFLCLINIIMIYTNCKNLPNIKPLVEDNCVKFAKTDNKDTQLDSLEKDLFNSYVGDQMYSSASKQIHAYLEVAIEQNPPIIVHKANIRITNAMIDWFKKSTIATITYADIFCELETKIGLAKRNFVKKECIIAIEILKLIESGKSADYIVKCIVAKYS